LEVAKIISRDAAVHHRVVVADDRLGNAKALAGLSGEDRVQSIERRGVRG
jgi:hypothetical protein